MKKSAEYAGRLKKLCNKLKREYKTGEKQELMDPATGLILGCLSEVTTENKANIALNKLCNYFVDFNELRVCRTDEVVEVFAGKTFPQARDVSKRILGILKHIYEEDNSLDLTELKSWGKREAKSFLEKLRGITPYVVSWVMLHSFEAHSFPVNEHMLSMLINEEVVRDDADMAVAQGFLERQILAHDIYLMYHLLRKHADKKQSRCGSSAIKDVTKTGKTKKTVKIKKAKTKETKK